MIPPHSKDASMKQHLEDCKASGLSQSIYCKQHNIPTHIFSYYKKKLGYIATSKPSSNNNQLVPINLMTKPSTSKPIKINHANGFSLEINSDDIDLSHLKPLLELLRSVT